MKRLHIVTNIILIIVAFMLQSMLFVHVSFPAVKPNLLLIVTVLSGFLPDIVFICRSKLR